MVGEEEIGNKKEGGDDWQWSQLGSELSAVAVVWDELDQGGSGEEVQGKQQVVEFYQRNRQRQQSGERWSRRMLDEWNGRTLKKKQEVAYTAVPRRSSADYKLSEGKERTGNTTTCHLKLSPDLGTSVWNFSETFDFEEEGKKKSVTTDALQS